MGILSYLGIGGGILAVIVGLIIWARIERAAKKKAIEKADMAELEKKKAEKRVHDIGENVDRLLDYNSKDAVVKQDVENRIIRFRDTRSKTDAKKELAKLRADLFDICVSD